MLPITDMMMCLIHQRKLIDITSLSRGRVLADYLWEKNNKRNWNNESLKGWKRKEMSQGEIRFSECSAPCSHLPCMSAGRQGGGEMTLNQCLCKVRQDAGRVATVSLSLCEQHPHTHTRTHMHFLFIKSYV